MTTARIPATGDRIVHWIQRRLMYHYGIDFAFRGTPTPLKSSNPSSPTWDFADGVRYGAGNYIDMIGKVNRIIEMAQARFDLEPEGEGEAAASS